MCSDFMFDPDEYERVKRDWEDLRAQVDEVRDRFGNLGQVTSQLPADDLATRGFVHRAQTAADAARHSNAALRDYATAFLAKLDQTAAQYAKRDDDNAQVIIGSPTPRT